MNAHDILYTGLALTHIPIPINTLLDEALVLIDAAIGSGSGSSPDYSGYSLACIKQTDGTTHPTNTQNFAEGISKIVCDNRTDFDDFVSTTYAADSSAFTAAINTLGSPGLTYVPFSITNTDTNTQVWNKSFTGFTGIINSIKPDSANWSSIGASSITSIVAAFNAIIAHQVVQDSSISGKQASLGTFNTTSIGGSTGQAPITTINALITFAAALPTYTTGSVTWGCVAQGGTLTTDINNIVSKVNLLSSNYLADVDNSSLEKTSIGSCLGYRAAINPDWIGLFKVAVDVDDAADSPDYLENKIESTDATVTITNTGSTLDLSVPASADAGKVKINNSDTAGYLVDKLPNAFGDWGLAITPYISSGQLILKPTVTNPGLFIQNFITIASEDDDLKAQLCALIAGCYACNCESASSFSVTLTTA